MHTIDDLDDGLADILQDLIDYAEAREDGPDEVNVALIHVADSMTPGGGELLRSVDLRNRGDRR